MAQLALHLSRGLPAAPLGPTVAPAAVALGIGTRSPRMSATRREPSSSGLFIPPEDVLLRAIRPPDTANVLCGSVQTVTYMGNFVEYVVRAAGHDWRVQTHPHERFKLGDEVSLVLPPERCLCLPHLSASAYAPRHDPQD